MKILAFFGSDLDPVTGPEYLLKSNREGYALLALDSGAMAAATSAGLDYTLMEDWLSPETILRAIEDAAACETGWYEPARDEFTADGICWPELDLLAMHWFWRTAMIAQAASTEFRRLQIEELRFFGRHFARPAALTERSEVWNALWKYELRERAVQLRSRERRETRIRRELLSRAVTRLRSLVGNPGGNQSGAEQVVREGSIILMLAQLDTHRTVPLIEDLSRQFPGRVAGVAGGPYITVARDMSRRLNIPVTPGAPAPLSPQVPLAPLWMRKTIDSGLQAKFGNGYSSALQSSEGQVWERVLRVSRFHFNYYCKHRWPFLHKMTFPFWLQLWRSVRPALILVSNINAYYQSACVAAQRLGIPTALIPHGGVQGFPRSLTKLLLTDYVLYEGEHQRRTFEKAGASQSKLVGCRSILGRDEYPTRTMQLASAQAKLRVVALLNPTADGQNLIPLITAKAQIEAFRVLAAPPPDIEQKVDICLKVHPSYSDLGIIAAASADLRNKVLPPESDLMQLLEETDLFIAVNYMGSALVPVLLAGKPCIYLLTESQVMLARPDWNLTLLMEGTTLVRNANDLWATISAFCSDPEVKSGMASKSRQYSEKYLDTSGLPAMGELIKELLPC
jgi:hypothetical protein